ncbi:OLC1v1024126C1 [Oldenlandia corymbosa var. corymbosa]|uniref:OLC1v1024126C1 n=1 Tax=Oldenlandia corymbosa var. corymbosa TaxID=529605 RepID=A0AAV1C306_OLDCO|nr:OLC1v1024126C1 [Oldenlandia corymbosa var. corymbosa]
MKVQLAKTSSKVAAKSGSLAESGSKKVQKKVDQSSENSPGKVGAMRKKFLADQRKATLSKNKEKETGDNVNNTLPSISSIISGWATLKTNPSADIDPLMKEKLKVKEKNRAMIKSEQCGEIGSSYKVCPSPKDDVKLATTATLKKPPRRDAPKKLVVQEENLPKEVQQEDAMEAAEERRKERGASRRALELMEKTVQVEDNFQLMADFEMLTGCSVHNGFGPELGLRQLQTGKVLSRSGFSRRCGETGIQRMRGLLLS